MYSGSLNPQGGFNLTRPYGSQPCSTTHTLLCQPSMQAGEVTNTPCIVRIGTVGEVLR